MAVEKTREEFGIKISGEEQEGIIRTVLGTIIRIITFLISLVLEAVGILLKK